MTAHDVKLNAQELSTELARIEQEAAEKKAAQTEATE